MQFSHILYLSILLHAALLLYGIYQDSVSDLKYTDIDYYVFTDAARYVYNGSSPYMRETYRYTPLLAWLLCPTVYWFTFGKVLFCIGNIIAGILLYKTLCRRLPATVAANYSALWLLNPMAAQISTRGSSEGLLDAIVICSLYLFESGNLTWSALVTGFAIHLKLYPIIYVPAYLWAISDKPIVDLPLLSLVNRERLKFITNVVLSFSALTTVMYAIYGWPFLLHSYIHHFSRLDHRHNYSVYNELLMLAGAPSTSNILHSQQYRSLAFIPQLILSGVLLPLAYAKSNLSKCLFLQTLIFVAFNKVCTAQYFLWYLVFIPLVLPNTLMARKRSILLGAVALWVAPQALWLVQAYKLEFLGEQTFFPELFGAEIVMFICDTVIADLVIRYT
ncbi:glycosyltransferase family 50 protein [Tortispora caseinolytica NRRL Y-17796]|uniref:GPI mannosyltransferase 1 n=1 Tax=Tortispora caseinolytica NRRL Y-17796 TaxID=767744 RepID=A0A1E4TEP0_9ASCO|nr:glycosyltransferase family 50 protein [Tortispora caseinolytica NRRL Y-17796]